MKENEEYKLKPCPFCGGEAVLKESRQPDGNCSYKCAIIKCQSCGCNTGYYTIDGYYGATTTIQDTVNAWNKRDENREFDRDTALAVLKDFSRDMYPSYDIFGRKTLVINRDEFEAIRKKFLDAEVK